MTKEELRKRQLSDSESSYEWFKAQTNYLNHIGFEGSMVYHFNPTVKAEFNRYHTWLKKNYNITPK